MKECFLDEGVVVKKQKQVSLINENENKKQTEKSS